MLVKVAPIPSAGTIALFKEIEHADVLVAHSRVSLGPAMWPLVGQNRKRVSLHS